MHGYGLIEFPASILGPEIGEVELARFRTRDGEGEFQTAINASPLNGFEASRNTSQDDWVRVDAGVLEARIEVAIDPRTDTQYGEDRAWAGKEVRVDLFVWVSVDRSRPVHLRCGTVSTSENRVGVEIVNNPTKDDKTRMRIHVIAPTLAEARATLLATLRGELRPETPWIT